jgi:hypothetical protein
MLEEAKVRITRDQAKDTGMAMVLICLLLGLLAEWTAFYPLAAIVLVLNMIWPDAYRPVAKVWLGLSHLLGTFVSKILLSAVFYLLVLPVGLLRRMLGKDSLKLMDWKRGRDSAFKFRNHRYSSADIETPY